MEKEITKSEERRLAVQKANEKNPGGYVAQMRERETGCLWIEDGKFGKFFSIVINSIDEFGIEREERYVAFRNKFKKEGDKKPDFQIYKPQKKTEKPPELSEDSKL